MRRQMLAAALQLLLPGMPMIYYGDEVGMTGGSDPDCRRGMLWEGSRQNQTLFHYYQTLIHIRHQYPALTEGTLTEQSADDERGLITIKRQQGRQRLRLLFHVKAGTLILPELAGRKNLVDNRDFSGILGDFEAAVLLE